MSMYETGAARRSLAQPDPVLHLLTRIGNDWVMWCSGGPGERVNTMTHRRCPKCLALARRDLAENGEPGEPSDLDWYIGRYIRRKAADTDPIGG
jgi:hypothetical protein